MDVKVICNGFMGIAIIMLLGGCSDPVPSSEDDSGPTGVDNVTLGGIAAKGIIKLGNVVAEELKADGTVLAQVGSATTDADGHYSLSVNDTYLGGPIKVTVSADTRTQMKCDIVGGCGTRTDGLEDVLDPIVVDFGEWYKPGSLNMMALVAEAAANSIIDVNITPYTDLAANHALITSGAAATSRAQDAGSLTPAKVYDANSEVSNLLGLNILDTQPVDITDITAINNGGATEVVYAAVSAAVLADTAEGGGNPDINGALETLSDSFSGGEIIADDGGENDSAISLQEIIDGAMGVLGEMGIADLSGVLGKLLTDVEEAPDGGTVDPEPSNTADEAALVKVKSFVGDVRTWGSAIESETGVNGGAFDLQTGLITSAAELSMDFLFGPAFFASVEAIEAHFHGRNISQNLADYATGSPTDPQFTAGSIAKSDDVITITDGIIDGVTVNMSMRLPEDGKVLASGSSFTIEIVSASFESATTDATINSGKVVLNPASEYIVDWTAIDAGSAVMPSILTGSVYFDMTMTQKQDESGTPLESAITFAGTLSSTFVNPSVVSDEIDDDNSEIIPGILIISGSVSDTVGNSFDASFTFNIANIEFFVLTGTMDLATPKTGFDFTMQLAGLPEASVNVNGTKTAGSEEGDVITTITYGTRQIKITSDLANSTEGIIAVGDVAITNQDGVTMNVDGTLSELEGDVLLDGVKHAEIKQMDNGAAKITYTDGTFEIL